ncbi:ZIP family metal transporter [Myxosarcina sp. GI1(2024)]
MPLFYLGTIGSLLAGLTTGIGGFPVLFVSEVSKRIQGILLGFGAGVMLAATSFSLLIPSIEAAASGGGSSIDAANIVVAGTLLGGVFLWVTHRYFPYQRYIKQPQGSDFENLKGIWLFVMAIAIHNFPEGLAVGVGFGGGNLGNGLALAIGIGLQNLPEGLAVALALITENYSKWRAFWIALLTGLLEPVGGLLGAGVISLGEILLPWGMSFAAGAMLFVICDRIIPRAQNLGRGKEVTASLMVGFVVMMYLDVTLG